MSPGDRGDGLFARVRTAADRRRDDDGRRFNRRLVVLLVLLLLVPLGAGLGTVEFDLPAGGDDAGTGPVALTPTNDSAATPTPEGPNGPPSGETDAPTAPAGSGTGTDGTTAGGGSGGTAVGDDGTEAGGGGSTPAGGSGGGSAPGDGDVDTPTPGDGSGVSLQTTGPQLSVAASKLAPDASGRGTVTYRNAGNRTGRFSVANLDVEDRENGIVPAERPVDNTSDAGELSEAVHAELWIETDSGTTYLYGTESRARTLAALGSAGDGGDAVELAPGETATVVLVWRVPEDTGNEIQSDGVSFDATISLTAT